MGNSVNRLMFFQHLVFWIGFLFINAYISFTFFPVKQAIYRFTVLTLINIIVYWICLKYPVNLFFERKKYGLFILCLVSIILLSSLIKIRALGIVLPHLDFQESENKLADAETFGTILVFFTQGIVVGIATLLAISKNKILTEKRLNEIMAVKTKTELELLKSKINPHFLLNTLNNIYYYSGENNAKGGNAILKLGELLRYTTYDSTQPRITLEKELTTIESLAQLYALRFSTEPNIRIRVHNEAARSSWIPPGILLTLFENALKYSAAGSMADSYIRVDISRNGRLSISVENSIADPDKSLQNIYGGMGLKSLRKILELEYPNRHALTIHNALTVFTAQLDISDE